MQDQMQKDTQQKKETKTESQQSETVLDFGVPNTIGLHADPATQCVRVGPPRPGRACKSQSLTVKIRNTGGIAILFRIAPGTSEDAFVNPPPLTPLGPGDHIDLEIKEHLGIAKTNCGTNTTSPATVPRQYDVTFQTVPSTCGDLEDPDMYIEC